MDGLFLMLGPGQMVTAKGDSRLFAMTEYQRLPNQLPTKFDIFWLDIGTLISVFNKIYRVCNTCKHLLNFEPAFSPPLSFSPYREIGGIA